MEDDFSIDLEEYIRQWRKEAVRVEREREARYPHHFTFFFKDEGGDLEDDTFYAMRDWCKANCTQGSWLETGDSIGTTVKFWFDDPNIAMRFKLTFK